MRCNKQMGNRSLQLLVGRKVDGVSEPLGFKTLINLRPGKSRIRPEIMAQTLVAVAGNQRFPDPPSVSALCTLPGRVATRSSSPNWLKTHSG